MENPRGPNAGALLLLPQGRDCAARGAMGPQPRHRQPAPRQGGAGTLARPSRPARAPVATPPPREPGGRRLRICPVAADVYATTKQRHINQYVSLNTSSPQHKLFHRPLYPLLDENVLLLYPTQVIGIAELLIQSKGGTRPVKGSTP